MPVQISANSANQAPKPQNTAIEISKKDFLETFTVLPKGRFRTTPSGLKIAVISEGQGKPIENGMKVRVNYTGWLSSGKEFDSSTRRNEPFELTLGSGQVIKGWEEGLAGMKVGERRQLIIAPDLAYGNRKVGKIPPGSTLIFNVELVSVEGSSPNPKGNLSVVA